MSRYYPKQLKEDLETLNDALIVSGSTYYLASGARNGMQAVDVMHVDASGGRSCQNNLEAGTSLKCYTAARHYAAGYAGYIYPQKAKGLTRMQAKALLSIAGVDFTRDFFQLSAFDVEKLVTWAKLTRYRKPKHANGSIGRYFFQHLKTKV